MTWLRIHRLALHLLALMALGAAFAVNAQMTLPRTIDLNTANQAQLEMVKGVGPQLSERILAERASARFESWDDFIARMKGIGPSHALRLSNAGLRVTGQPYTPAQRAQAGSGAADGPPAK
jgi:competence protein ComEA